jgi:hypothetical protein
MILATRTHTVDASEPSADVRAVIDTAMEGRAAGTTRRAGRGQGAPAGNAAPRPYSIPVNCSKL